MSEEKRKISRATYLQALGLFTLGRSHMKRIDECVHEIETLMGVPQERRLSSHFADEIYGLGAASLDDALDRSDIEVEAE